MPKTRSRRPLQPPMSSSAVHHSAFRSSPPMPEEFAQVPPSTFQLRRKTRGSFLLVPCPRLGRSIRCQGQLQAAAATILGACPSVVSLREPLARHRRRTSGAMARPCRRDGETSKSRLPRLAGGCRFLCDPARRRGCGVSGGEDRAPAAPRPACRAATPRGAPSLCRGTALAVLCPHRTRAAPRPAPGEPAPAGPLPQSRSRPTPRPVHDEPNRTRPRHHRCAGTMFAARSGPRGAALRCIPSPRGGSARLRPQRRNVKR
jgi:hypothetical protein